MIMPIRLHQPELRAAASTWAPLCTLLCRLSTRPRTTLVPEIAVTAGILDNTQVVVRRLDADHPSRRIALVGAGLAARERVRMLADSLKASA